MNRRASQRARTGLRVLAGAVAILIAACGTGESSEDADEGVDLTSLPFPAGGWETDFEQHSVPLDEFRSGGPPPDGIPPIDDPVPVSISEGDEFLSDDDPVAMVEVSGEARAYPIRIMTWHEIANDELGGEAIAVTYCPLCNSTIAFSREIDGRELTFGTTGLLRNSNLVMWDRETESWWQQLTADAVVGELTGAELELLPSQQTSWREFKRLHPDGDVLSEDTGADRDYGRNPYVLYDSTGRIIGGTEVDETLPAKERVAAIQVLTEGAVVYPFSRLREDHPVNDEIGDTEIVVFYDPDVRSAIDTAAIDEGRRVGASAVFERRLGDRALSFEPGPDDGSFRDLETGSVWDMRGRAVSGELEGEQLAQVPHDDELWFALAAFYPDADIKDG